jgi:outer membrane lipoprotein SlyB
VKQKIVLGLFALAGLLPLAFTATTAQAQQSSASAAPRIDGFDVEPVSRPAAGSELLFTLYGSPGGAAAVQISGATGGLTLVESEPGVYEGTYTIRSRDRISAASTATANLRVGNKVASSILDEPLVGKANAGRVAQRPGAVGAPKIDRFDVDPPARLVAGEELILSMTGTPGGAASARIVGVKGKLVLDEIKPGAYEGIYTIKNRDRIAANATVTGNLRVGARETNQVLGRSLLSGAGNVSRARTAAPVCANCGTVEAVNLVEVKGEGSYLGKVLGGVAGVLIGSQIGSGRGTTVAEVAGGAGGVFAGNEIEKRMKTTKHFEVVVRLENGGSQTFSYAAQPGFAVGAKVKVENGVLVAV